MFRYRNIREIPIARLIADAAVDRFDTTALGRVRVVGTAFAITTTRSGHASKPATIAQHSGNTDPITEGLVDDYSAALRWHQSNL